MYVYLKALGYVFLVKRIKKLDKPECVKITYKFSCHDINLPDKLFYLIPILQYLKKIDRIFGLSRQI